ncbi:MAG: exported protein [Herbaspirillum sp.]|nr:exported protein [Herbaspirillum sp.]
MTRLFQRKPAAARWNTAIGGLLVVAVTLIAMPPVPAQAQNATRPLPSLREPAIDRVAAPIALYPDALLAQVLMASTYPLDIAEAAPWAERRATLTADQIGRAAAAQRWESSVKALLPFAPILTMMRSEKTWTGQLADAVIKQPAALLNAIQRLRERAYDNGALHSTRQQQVQRQDTVVRIDPADTQRIYVPYYDAAQVYSPAGNSLLPPEYWAAQPYAAPQNRGAGNGVAFSAAVEMPDRAFYDAAIDWRGGRLLTRATLSAATVSAGLAEWRHDPQYRKHQPPKPTSDSIGTEAPPASGTSVGTPNTGASPERNSGSISTRPPRSGGH